MKELTKLDIPSSRVENGKAHGTVIRADVYGNLVTNITSAQLDVLGVRRGDTLRIILGDKPFAAPLVSAYADVPEGEKLVVIQSSGLVECAINKGNLAESLGAGLHAPVSIERRP